MISYSVIHKNTTETVLTVYNMDGMKYKETYTHEHRVKLINLIMIYRLNRTNLCSSSGTVYNYG